MPVLTLALPLPVPLARTWTALSRTLTVTLTVTLNPYPDPDANPNQVLALFGGLGIELIGDRARKFDTENAQTAYAHFNLKILGRIPKSATGMFADLMKATDRKHEPEPEPDPGP